VWYFDRELDAYAMLSFDMYTPKYRAGATTLFFFFFQREEKRKQKRMGDCGKEGSDGGIGVKLKELYEDEKRRIVEKGIAGTIAEHKT
jgi:hypothetical protein